MKIESKIKPVTKISKKMFFAPQYLFLIPQIFNNLHVSAISCLNYQTISDTLNCIRVVTVA